MVRVSKKLTNGFFDKHGTTQQCRPSMQQNEGLPVSLVHFIIRVTMTGPASVTVTNNSTTAARQCPGSPLGTHLTPYFTYVLQHTILLNNMNHVTSVSIMNPAYDVMYKFLPMSMKE